MWLCVAGALGFGWGGGYLLGFGGTGQGRREGSSASGYGCDLGWQEFSGINSTGLVARAGLDGVGD